MSAPQIIDVYPAPGAQGIVLGDRITVLFDQEMDETSINSGTFVVVGPDNDFIFGPDFTPIDKPGFEDENILNSPYFEGFVEGVITCERVDAYGSIVDVYDYTGAGNVYYTRAVFTPSKPFAPGVLYQVIVAGDEVPADEFETGIRSRTVFDTELLSVSGSGRLTFGGGYTGDTDKEYTIEITTGGATGDAEYIWWEEADPLTTFTGITTTGRRELEYGVWVECDHDGSFTVGDTFHVVVRTPVVLEDNYEWSFTTGTGSIHTPPSTSSTTGITESINTSVGGLTVSSISPHNMTCNIDPDDLTTIVVTFNKAINSATITDLTVRLWSESVNGDIKFSSTGTLVKTLTLNSNILTISGITSLYENNIIFLELDEVIAATDGSTLEEDTEYYFTTTYNPLYSSIRRVRLDLGPLIAGVPDETIYFAIFEASLLADANNFSINVSPANVAYFNHGLREFTTCAAELTLVRGLMGESGLSDRMSKTLGDLSVSRGGAFGRLKEQASALQDCVARWGVVVRSHGNVSPDTSIRPQTAVKGNYAEDYMYVGRQWEPMSSFGEGSIPAANDVSYNTERRQFRTYRRRGS